MTEIKAKPRVLVADDEHVIADTLATILNRLDSMPRRCTPEQRPSTLHAPPGRTLSSRMW